MKIAFLVPFFPSLSQTFILNQITGLMNQGHDIRIISCYYPMEDLYHPDIERYGLIKRTSYLGIPPRIVERIARGILMDARNLPADPRSVLDSLNFVKHGRTVGLFNFAYAAQAMLDYDFDIIQCHFGPCGILGSFLRERGLKGKLLVCFHAHDLTVYPRVLGKGVYRKLFQSADLIQAITEYAENLLISLGCDRTRMKRLPMGIQVDRFTFKERSIAPGQPVKVLSIGRLVEKKGIEYALRAFAELKSRGLEYRYIVAGDGPLRENLENLAKSLGIEQHVQFLGPVDQNEAIRLFLDCHIFIAPSVTARNHDQEGLPLVILEAQATGMPVISTLHAGIPEGMLACESGFLVPERDFQSLAERLYYLASHPEKWYPMGLRGHEFVEENHDSSKLSLRLQGTYQELLQVNTSAEKQTL